MLPVANLFVRNSIRLPKIIFAQDLVMLGLGIATKILFIVINEKIAVESPQIFLYSKKDEPPTLR